MAMRLIMAPRGVPAERWRRLTPFQQAVYRAICGIPKGETRTYHWVAAKIGKPSAARAVGQALHVNPFAPGVPCHRVIRTDGSLGGYAKGLAAKRRLLQQEGWARLASA